LLGSLLIPSGFVRLARVQVQFRRLQRLWYLLSSVIVVLRGNEDDLRTLPSHLLEENRNGRPTPQWPSHSPGTTHTPGAWNKALRNNGDDDLISKRSDRTQKRIRIRLHVAMKNDRTGLVENAEIHGSSVQIDSAVMRMLLRIESHRPPPLSPYGDDLLI